MALTLPTLQSQIIDGPSKFDLVMSAADGKIVQITFQDPEKRSTAFKINPKINVRFLGLNAEDGSNESWYGKFIVFSKGYESETRTYYYDTRIRKGHIVSKF
jgi:hypothetical protein